MPTSSNISIGLAHEFILTACKAGFKPKDFTVLAQSEEKLRRVLCFVRGHAEVTQVTHVIDCDADPSLPCDDWQVEEHRKGGQFTWDPTKISLYLSESQRGEKYIEGNKLRKELAKKPVLNANVHDYLIRHPHLIPEELKVDENGDVRFIHFWGTIYRNPDGDLCVRNLLCCSEDDFAAGFSSLDYDFREECPAVVRAN